MNNVNIINGILFYFFNDILRHLQNFLYEFNIKIDIIVRH